MGMARFHLMAKCDGARPIPVTVLIDRTDRPLFRVRPKRRRREFVLPFDVVIDMAVSRVVKAEVFKARLEKAEARKQRKARR